MNQEPIEQNAPALGASRHLPALVIDLNALAASGEPQPQVLEHAQEAVLQALQHVFGQMDGDDLDAESTADGVPADPSAPEKQNFCAVGWACASGEGRVQAAVQQALAHPLLHAALQQPGSISKLGIALSTLNEPLPMAEMRAVMQHVAERFASDIDMQMDYDPKATDVPAAHVKASIWVVWSAPKHAR